MARTGISYEDVRNAAETLLGRGLNPTIQRIRELLAKRQPIYDAIPLHVVTDGLSTHDVATRVIALFDAQPCA